LRASLKRFVVVTTASIVAALLAVAIASHTMPWAGQAPPASPGSPPKAVKTASTAVTTATSAPAATTTATNTNVITTRSGGRVSTGVSRAELFKPGGKPVTAREYVKLMGVGIDVDWLTFSRVRHYYFYWRSRGVNIPALFREKGFSNVRIRVGGDVTSNETLLKMLKEVVQDCLRAGVIPIITYTADDLRNNPTSLKAQEHFVRWWVTVAECFKGAPYALSYDLLIESSGKIKDYPNILNKVYNETIAAIRKIDRYRILIVTPAHVSSPFYLKYLKVRWDPYMIAEWHIYAGGPTPLKRGGPYNETFIREAVEAAVSWSREHGIPTWVGAWRPVRLPKHGIKQHYPDGAPKGIYPMSVDIKFAKVMVEALKSAGIPYDVNADALYFNIKDLKWYPSQEPLLKVILQESDPRS